jgi:RND family efflux transporter MFP subunit
MATLSHSNEITSPHIGQSLRSILIRVVFGVVLLAFLVLGGWWIYRSVAVGFGQGQSMEGLSFTVARRAVTDSVVERGTLESQNTVIGRCDLPGWENKIIFIVPEGTFVKKDDVVVRFDSASIDKAISEFQSKLIDAEGKLEQAKQGLEVQNNKNESDIAAAELELALAELDLEKYRDGDFIAEKADKERSISEGEAELRKAVEDLANMRILVRKGFRSPEQLRELESRVSSFESRVERDKQQYRVLMDYDHKRKITEFDAKASEAKRKLERSKTTAIAETKKAESQVDAAKAEVELVKGELAALEANKKNCEIVAPQDGTVAYANERWYDDSDRIREGATVRRQQNVFFLPDMTKMQVKVNIHESVVNKIKNKMPAAIRVDAYPELPLSGKVSFVAELAASTFGTTKNYEVVVLVESIPETMKIKPGMTAQVEIYVGRYKDILAVPVGAITEHQKSSFIYVREGIGKIVRRVVTTGRTTHAYIEVVDGIAEGDVVMLDAYQRGMQDFGESEKDSGEIELESLAELDLPDDNLTIEDDNVPIKSQALNADGATDPGSPPADPVDSPNDAAAEDEPAKVEPAKDGSTQQPTEADEAENCEVSVANPSERRG